MAENDFTSFDLQCENCGADATVRFAQDEYGWYVTEIKHEGCDHPVLSIMCDNLGNLRKLGVITGTT